MRLIASSSFPSMARQSSTAARTSARTSSTLLRISSSLAPSGWRGHLNVKKRFLRRRITLIRHFDQLAFLIPLSPHDRVDEQINS